MLAEAEPKFKYYQPKLMYKLFSDGGARGNPGPAATGYLLYDAKDNLLASGSDYLGATTNNVAEYKALIAGLNLALKNEVSELVCHLDSELVVKQLNGQYKVKHPAMRELFAEVAKLKAKFQTLQFKHVLRESNKEADALVNETLDRQQ